MTENTEFLEEAREEQYNRTEFIDDVIWHIQMLESYKHMSDHKGEIQQIDKQIAELENAVQDVTQGDLL